MVAVVCEPPAVGDGGTERRTIAVGDPCPLGPPQRRGGRRRGLRGRSHLRGSDLRARSHRITRNRRFGDRRGRSGGRLVPTAREDEDRDDEVEARHEARLPAVRLHPHRCLTWRDRPTIRSIDRDLGPMWTPEVRGWEKS